MLNLSGLQWSSVGSPLLRPCHILPDPLRSSRIFSSCLGWARGGLGGRSGLRSGRFDAECLLGYSLGHRRALERCVSLRGGLGERSGLRSGRFAAECLLGYSVGHRRVHERCFSLRAASLRAWGERGAALSGEAAFDRATLMRNACWAIAWAIGALTSDAFRFAPLLFAPWVGAGWPWRAKRYSIGPL